MNNTRCDLVSTTVKLCFVHRECFKSPRCLRCRSAQGLCCSLQRVTWKESAANHQQARALLTMIVPWEEKEMLRQVIFSKYETDLLFLHDMFTDVYFEHTVSYTICSCPKFWWVGACKSGNKLLSLQSNRA